MTTERLRRLAITVAIAAGMVAGLIDWTAWR